MELVIFDLDGVLLDSKEIHYESLNSALRDIDEKYVIIQSGYSIQTSCLKYSTRN